MKSHKLNDFQTEELTKKFGLEWSTRLRDLCNAAIEMAENFDLHFSQPQSNAASACAARDSALSCAPGCRDFCKSIENGCVNSAPAAPNCAAKEEGGSAPRTGVTGAHWAVFNSGACVADGLTMQEAMDYLTPERFERGWTAVYCLVVNNDNQWPDHLIKAAVPKPGSLIEEICEEFGVTVPALVELIETEHM